MHNWFERLKQKPKAVKEQYAFFGALAFTLIIAGVWVVSLPAKLASISSQYNDDDQAASAFSNFVNEAKDGIGNILSDARKNSQIASTTASSTGHAIESTSTDPAFRFLELEQETLQQINEEERVRNTPQPRTVLIATTSIAASSSAEN